MGGNYRRSSFSRSTGKREPAEVLLRCGKRFQVRAGQTVGELVGLEPVNLWVHRERLKEPGLQGVPRYVLEEQQPSGLQHPGNLAHRTAPVGDVVDDPELDDGVHTCGGLVDIAGVSFGERHRAARTIVQATLRLAHHERIEIERGYPFGQEAVEQHLYTDTAPAPDFEDVLPAQIASGEPPKPRRLTVMLMRGT
jgi:hypothetical protein